MNNTLTRRRRRSTSRKYHESIWWNRSTRKQGSKQNKHIVPFFLEKRGKEIEGDDCRGVIVETSEKQKKVYTYNQVSEKNAGIYKEEGKGTCVQEFVGVLDILGEHENCGTCGLESRKIGSCY